MGISDDIKPKKASPELPKDEEEKKDEVEEQPQVSGEEIPIDKSAENEPVYEDLLPRTPKPFEHLEDTPRQTPAKPDTLAELINTKTESSEDHKEAKKEKSSENQDEEEKPVPRKDSFKSFAEYHEKQPRKSHLLTIIIILFVLLLTALLILQNFDQIKELIGIKSEVSTTDKPISNGVEVIGNEDIKPADSASESSSQPAASTPTTTTPAATPPAATAPAATTPAASVSDLKVKVLNGNGIAGSAASVKSKLEAAGYTVSTLTNASRFTYTKTIIYFNANKQTEATALAAVLSDRQTETILNASVAGTFDLVVVVGAH